MAEKRNDNTALYWLLCAAAVLALLCLYLFDDAMPENTYDDCDITGSVEDTEGHPVVNFEIVIRTQPNGDVLRRMNEESDNGIFAFSLPPGPASTSPERPRSAAITTSGRRLSCTWCSFTRVCRAMLLRAVYSANISRFMAWQAAVTMDCNSAGNRSNAFLLTVHSAVAPGSCHPG